MTTTKAYTTIEQARELAEILPLESADMYYNPRPSKEIPHVGNANTTLLQVPCWSFAALLDIIPKRIKGYNVLRIDVSEDFAIWYDEIGFGVNNKLPDVTKKYAIDACVEMIENLHKLNLL